MKGNEEAAEAKEDVCGVCLEKVKVRGKISCVHQFCFDCIQEWSKTSNTCPLCKKRFRVITKEEEEEVLEEKKGKNKKGNKSKKKITKFKVKRADQHADLGEIEESDEIIARRLQQEEEEEEEENGGRVSDYVGLIAGGFVDSGDEIDEDYDEENEDDLSGFIIDSIMDQDDDENEWTPNEYEEESSSSSDDDDVIEIPPPPSTSASKIERKNTRNHSHVVLRIDSESSDEGSNKGNESVVEIPRPITRSTSTTSTRRTNVSSVMRIQSDEEEEDDDEYKPPSRRQRTNHNHNISHCRLNQSHYPEFNI